MTSRRHFLRSTAAVGSLAALGDLAFLGKLRPVSADEAKLPSNLVRLQSDIEPLVRLLEETPRAKLLEEVGGRVKKGLGYRDLLAALMLAGVRNIQPRPAVGFKFHAVLVVNSAHLASLNSPDQHRWLPLFWAMDNFKSSQAKNQEEGGWRMAAPAEAKVPPARKVKRAFVEAMDNWDEEAADTAAAGLARAAGRNECFELFARYGCRDYRDIGHKAIFVANAFRTLDAIGWRHAEPVLRSLAYALLKHEGDNPAKRAGGPDLPGRANQKRVGLFPDGWLEGKADSGATTALLETLREASSDDVCGKVVEQIGKGVSPSSVWDALFLGAGELLMRQPGIVGLHTLTTANALRYAYDTSGDDSTRRMLLLQCAAFLPLFRNDMKGRGKIGEVKIDAMEPMLPPGEIFPPEKVFDEVGKNRETAAQMALTYLKGTGDAKGLIDLARVLIFLKGTDSHDYKFSMATLEDYAHVSPPWRDRFFAASTYWLKGSGAKDSDLVKRVRAAL